jgi:hypothetical protein
MAQIQPGRPMAILNMDHWLDNLPAGAQLKRNGRSPEQRMQALRDRARKAKRSLMVERYNNLRTKSGETATATAKTLGDLQKQIDAALKGMKQGTVSPDEVMALCADGIKVSNRVNSVVDELERDDEAATSMIDMDPADYESLLIERFPQAAKGLPIVTEDYLLGEDDRDPLGEDS